MRSTAVSQAILPFQEASQVRDLKKSKFNHFNFKVVENFHDLQIAKQILKESYDSRFGGHLKVDFPAESETFSRYSTVFLLEEEGVYVGTFSIVRDAISFLPADLTFATELNERRMSPRRLSEICSLAVTNQCKHKREMMLYIVLIATLINLKHGVTDCVVTVKEKHKSFYKLLKFEELSVVKNSSRSSAKVMLMSINNLIASEYSGIQMGFFAPIKTNANNIWKYINDFLLHTNHIELYEKIGLQPENIFFEKELIEISVV